jgi:hypothetical protein
MPTPQGAYVEIVEKVKDESAFGIIVPNEVRINGTPLLVPDDEPITVHEVSTSAHDVVKVTLTLFARRVEFKSEVE